MKILQVKKYEEAEVILKLGVDFFSTDLKRFLDTERFTLKSEALNHIAKKNGLGKWTSTDFIDKYAKEIKVSFRKEIG